MFFYYVLFVIIPKIINSLDAVIHPWDVSEITTTFKEITPHVIILSVIEGILNKKADLRDDVVSKTIKELDRRGKYQMRDILKDFWYSIMNEGGRERGGIRIKID